MVRVLEVASVAAPECILSEFYDDSARHSRLFHDGVHFTFGCHVVTDREFSGAGLIMWQTRIVGKALARPYCKLQVRSQFKEGNRAVLKLGSYDPFRFCLFRVSCG